MSDILIDLDAPKREVAYPDGIPVLLGGETFTFPAELPLDALKPLLANNLDLMGIAAQVINDEKNDNIAGGVIDLLINRPHLPRTFLGAIDEVYLQLLGAEQFVRFHDKKPSIPDYVRLTKALIKAYGVNLGKLFGSPTSPTDGGTTSSSTSPTTTSETPATSGGIPETPPTSESAVSSS
ncbi:hypothetical protein [Kitasatospora sp. NPDC059327]|uniref:hypothetical protein n=1 Tax=Kitasatospora sp. NPDC059327 TaxID=3346803 RepID=UPI0036AA5701